MDCKLVSSKLEEFRQAVKNLHTNYEKSVYSIKKNYLA